MTIAIENKTLDWFLLTEAKLEFWLFTCTCIFAIKYKF